MPKQNSEHMRQYWSNTFAEIGQDPVWWVTQAQLLKKTAELARLKAEELADEANTYDGIIIPDRDLIDSVYRYLAGVTIENLLKAFIISKDPSLVGENESSKELKSHKMWTRYADGKLKTIKELLTEDEQKLLKPLEHYVIWKGRYPIATNASDYVEGHSLAADLDVNPESLQEFDACFNSIYDKLYNLLTGICLKKIFKKSGFNESFIQKALFH